MVEDASNSSSKPNKVSFRVFCLILQCEIMLTVLSVNGYVLFFVGEGG